MSREIWDESGTYIVGDCHGDTTASEQIQKGSVANPHHLDRFANVLRVAATECVWGGRQAPFRADWPLSFGSFERQEPAKQSALAVVCTDGETTNMSGTVHGPRRNWNPSDEYKDNNARSQ